MLRPKVGRLWANSSSVVRRDPGDAKYLIGWLSEIPTYQVLNYLQWKTDATILALAERGVLEWGPDVTYKKNAAVWDETNGRMYISTLDNPSKTLRPSQNANQWVGSAVQLSRSAYDATVKKIDDHVADVTGNPHKLTPGRLGTYTVAQIDALVAQYRAEVKTHSDNKDNPHNVTASQIGAVPVTGGNYTGNVTMDTGQVLLSTDGNRLIKADSTGVYLKNSAGAVGVDANGKGFVKIGTAAASEIVTQQTFADNKKTTEPVYSSPFPILYMPLIRDINLHVGRGTVTTDVDTQYDASGRLQLSGLDMVLSNPPLVGKTDVTIAVDVIIPNAGATNQTSTTIGLGSLGRARLFISVSGMINAYGDGVSTSQYQISGDKVRRVVMTRGANNVSLYIDGVLVQSVVGANVALDSYNLIDYNGNPLAINICNLRIWDSVLTDNQISAL